MKKKVGKRQINKHLCDKTVIINWAGSELREKKQNDSHFLVCVSHSMDADWAGKRMRWVLNI